MDGEVVASQPFCTKSFSNCQTAPKLQLLDIFQLLAHEPTCSEKKSNEQIDIERKAESTRNYEERKARRDKKNLKLKGVCRSAGSLSSFVGSSFAGSSSSYVGSSTAGSMTILTSTGSTSHDLPVSLIEVVARLMNLLQETNLILITTADEVCAGDNGGELYDVNDDVSKD